MFLFKEVIFKFQPLVFKGVESTDISKTGVFVFDLHPGRDVPILKSPKGPRNQCGSDSKKKTLQYYLNLYLAT